MSKQRRRVRPLANFMYDPDPPCPEAYDQPYECPDECFFIPVYNSQGGIERFKECCYGCQPGYVCPTPVRGFDFYDDADVVEMGGVWTTCIPVGLSATDREVRMAMAKSRITLSFLSVPKVTNPADFKQLFVPLVGDSYAIETSGWIIKYYRLPNLPSPAPFPTVGRGEVSPAQLPKSGISLSDKALTAMVVLPEGGTFNQYFVSVPESSLYTQPPYRYSQLLTSEWLVLFLRDPLPQKAANEQGDCGCG